MNAPVPSRDPLGHWDDEHDPRARAAWDLQAIRDAAAEVEEIADATEQAHTVGGKWDGSEPEAEARVIRLRALVVRLRLLVDPDRAAPAAAAMQQQRRLVP
jgi:hypothetical protein